MEAFGNSNIMKLSCLFLMCFGALPILSQAAGERGADTVCYNVFPLMTTSNGAPVDDKTSTMTAGPRGPVVLQDFVLLDELAHFNRERIPERVQHSKGAGAFGYFVVTNTSFAKYCKASLFETLGKKTELVARFSTTNQESGACDTVRALRGASIKFYTDDGNFDLLSTNANIFWIRDPILFSSLTHAGGRNPSTHLKDLSAFFDFITLRPEAIHLLLFLQSDKGIPDGYRHMDFHPTNVFKVVNSDGTPFYCKFHFTTDQGIQNLTSSQAQKLCSSDPDYGIRDLYTNIAKENYPSWTMYYQIMTIKQANEYEYDPFDVTKFWPTKIMPNIEIGKLVLNRNPTNYFADVEQAAFSPSHLVPGIEPSPDKMLQGRLFAYPDAQRYRLGVNYQQLPVNAPRVPIANNQRDGFMNYDNQGSAPNYYPNSYSESPKTCPDAAESKWPVTGDVARYHNDDKDYYRQPKSLWTNADDFQKERLVSNLADFLKNVSKELQERALFHFKQVNQTLAERVAAALGLSVV